MTGREALLARQGGVPVGPRARARHRPWWVGRVAIAAALVGTAGCSEAVPITVGVRQPVPLEELDSRLRFELDIRGFTGRIEEQLEIRLGRPIDEELAETGRLLFFDPVLSLSGDNSCAGCHGPNSSFNDSESISVGIGNNGIVGPRREGPRNLRRAPTILNAAFYPRMMWEGRFESPALDPFDADAGFALPAAEAATLSPVDHLIEALSFTPVVNRMEMAGFAFVGDNDAIRAEIARRVDAVPEYRTRFGGTDPAVAGGAPITYGHVAAALAEFMFTLVRADAPIDRYARGDLRALTPSQKRGALLFYGLRAGCFECHIGEGYASEMFSDFDAHVLAVPQVVPTSTLAVFDGPGGDEDYGLERHTGNPRDRYRFRTSPLRNVAYQPSFMHNGAFLCLEEAVAHHTDMYASLDGYDPDRLDTGLQATGPTEAMVERAHHLSKEPRDLSARELAEIIDFVRVGLADPDAHPDRLSTLVPTAVPSGLPLPFFDFTTRADDCR